MVHSVLLRDEKEYTPCAWEAVIQMRREETGNSQWREWERLQAWGLFSVYFNNNEVAATCPAKVKICALQKGNEARELCTSPGKLVFNLQHLHLLLLLYWSTGFIPGWGKKLQVQRCTQE